MAQIAFDASSVEPAVPLDLLPPGKYRAQIVQSEMQATKQGDGQMLCLEFDILDGPQHGRKLWDRLNLVNRSQQTVEIAQRQLSAICHAVDRIQVTDSEQLHFKPMMLTVTVELDNRDNQLPAEQRRKQNRIKGYAAAAASTASAAAAPPVRQAQPVVVAAAAPRPAATTASPPWRSKSV